VRASSWKRAGRPEYWNLDGGTIIPSREEKGKRRAWTRVYDLKKKE